MVDRIIIVQIFLVFGLAYILMGAFNYKDEATDKLYMRVWRMSPPSRIEYGWFGIKLILFEIVVDLVLNYLYYHYFK